MASVSLLGATAPQPTGVVGNFTGASGPLSETMFLSANAPGGSCIVCVFYYNFTTIYPLMTIQSVVDSHNGITFQGVGKLQSTTTDPAHPGVYIACEVWVGFGAVDASQSHYVVNLTMSNPCDSLTGCFAAFSGVNSVQPLDSNHSMPAGGSTGSSTSTVPGLSGLATSNPDDYLLAVTGCHTGTKQTAVTLNGAAAAFNSYAFTTGSPTFIIINSQLWGFPLSGAQAGMALAGNAADRDILMLALALTGDAPPPTRSFGSIIG